MTLSFKTTRNTGLAFLVSIIIVICIFSFYSISRIADSLRFLINSELPVREKADTITRIMVDAKNSFELYIRRDRVDLKDIATELDRLLEEMLILEDMLGEKNAVSGQIRLIRNLVLNLLEEEANHLNCDIIQAIKEAVKQKMSDAYKTLFELSSQIRDTPDKLRPLAEEKYQIVNKILSDIRFSFNHYMKITFSLNDVLIPIDRVAEECAILETIVGKDEKTAVAELIQHVRQFRMYVLNYVEQEHILYESSDTLQKMKASALKLEGEAHKSLIEVQQKIENRNKADYNRMFNVIAHIQFVMTAGVIAGIVFAIIGAFVMSRALMKPINRLLEATDRLAKGNLSYRVDVIFHDEIGQLANALNRMAEELENITVSRDTLAETKDLLNQSEERFRAIFRNAGIGIAVADENGRFVQTNPAFQKMLGYTAEAYAHMTFWELTHPDDREKQMMLWLDIKEEKKDFFQLEKRYLRCDGKLIWANLIVSSLKDAMGNTGYTVKMIEDITERRQKDEQLRQAYKELKETHMQLVQSAKLASIGELAAGVAHELNQPLMVIRTAAQVSIRGIGKNLIRMEQIAEHMETIERNTKRMMNIIGHLRSFSRQSQAEFDHTDINQTLEDAFLMIGEQLRLRNITVKKVFAPDLPKIYGNANQLEQVFLNLIANARDAIGDSGGEIELISRCIDSSKIVEIIIRDTGCGIHPDNVNRIFDPFFTTKDVGKGTGLGLSISYGIVKDHRGEIFVAETGTAGTTFVIRLPLSEG